MATLAAVLCAMSLIVAVEITMSLIQNCKQGVSRNSKPSLQHL